MAKVSVYLNFASQTEEAFNFYKSVFGGEFAMIMRFKDMATPGVPLSETEAEKIMHIALPIGKNVLMGNDVPESMGRVNENENRSKISISAESKEEAEVIRQDEIGEVFYAKEEMARNMSGHILDRIALAHTQSHTSH